MAYELVLNKKKTFNLHSVGFEYNKKGVPKKDGAQCWKCVEYRFNACPCSVYTFNQAIASTRLNHNHSGDSRKIWVSKVAAELRRDAATSLEPTQSMVERLLGWFPV